MPNFLKTIFSLSDDDGYKPNENINANLVGYGNIKVSHTLKNNRLILNQVFDKFSDLIIREIKITNNPEFGAMLVYLNNMTETGLIEESIIDKLTNKCEEYAYYPAAKEYSKYLFGIRDEDIHSDMHRVVDAILSGRLLLFIDGLDEAMVININKSPTRSIEEPQVESVIRGPREGFTESLSINIALLRKKIKNTNLKTEAFKIGRETKTDVVIAYLSNIANPKIVNEVRERLNRIDVYSVIGANNLNEVTTNLIGITFEKDRN